MNPTVLIVDDEEPIRSSLRGILEDESYAVLEAASGEEALTQLAHHAVQTVMLDIWMEGIDGIETLRRIKKKHPELPVIMMSGHGTIDTAVSATKMGAYDFLEKPLYLDRVLLLLERAMREFTLSQENQALKARMGAEPVMVGETPVMRALAQQIQRVASTSAWVLITGENGAGKEVAARQIHLRSERSNRPFIPVNSAAILEQFIESELFGHEAGAFPGAVTQRIGRFEQGDGGSVFLDEIGDMSLKTQAKILRVLQEQRFERVGGGQELRVNVRVIAASNKNLPDEIAAGRFREDLYYRLNVVPLRVPPLRERLEDIPLLVDHFIQLQRGVLPVRHFSREAMAALKGYHWPGNVRELKNLVERLLIMAPGSEILPRDLPEFLRPVRSGGGEGRSSEPSPWDVLLDSANLRDAREQFERAYLKAQLEKLDGNISRTADAVGMERSALHRKLKSLGLG
ncbi:MAG: sigma-54-dependent Fis family transcriptional regulator [Magnetococcales bacterium]|nr:sigma-54-dependent Fis family transcriptional regulator [Magnetococcales bacterium]